MLLSDFIQARREKRIEAAKVAAKVAELSRAEGIAEGRAKGRAEGDREKLIASGRVGSSPKGSRGTRREFTEPPPTQSQDKPKE